MNIQQLEYIVAVNDYRHFQKAAAACFVTPATLSMMIKKLEEELGVIIFDRRHKTVTPTDIGTIIIEKAKSALFHLKEVTHVATYANEDVAGIIRIGIIPTLAPYLTHLFLPSLMNAHPKLSIKLYEWNTNQIIDALKHNKLDIGIAATPLAHEDIKEHPLFYERLVAFSADAAQKQTVKKYLLPEDINIDKLWLLEEEHCLRSQVMNLCTLKKKNKDQLPLDFEAASIETLLNIVEINKGVTIIPELVLPTLTQQRLDKVYTFKQPEPVREISLLTYRYFIKQKVLQVVQQHILQGISSVLTHQPKAKNIIDIVK